MRDIEKWGNWQQIKAEVWHRHLSSRVNALNLDTCSLPFVTSSYQRSVQTCGPFNFRKMEMVKPWLPPMGRHPTWENHSPWNQFSRTQAPTPPFVNFIPLSTSFKYPNLSAKERILRFILSTSFIILKNTSLMAQLLDFGSKDEWGEQFP